MERPKRPRDMNQLAAQIVAESTREDPPARKSESAAQKQRQVRRAKRQKAPRNSAA